MSADSFEGDLALKSIEGGVDLAVENGLFVCDRGFSSAVCLSLFGGNKGDSGKVENKSGWWGNYVSGTDNKDRLVSRFQYIIASMPMTTSTIREAEEAAALDLAWLKDDGICDEIAVSGNAVGIKSFRLLVSLNKSGASLYSTEYCLQWEACFNGV